MSGSVVIGGAGGSSGGGPWVLEPVLIYNPGDSGETVREMIAQGDTSVPVAAGSVAVIIAIPPGAPECKLRTDQNVGDAGLPLNSGGLPGQQGATVPAPTLYPIGSGVTELILNFAQPYPQEFQLQFV